MTNNQIHFGFIFESVVTFGSCQKLSIVTLKVSTEHVWMAIALGTQILFNIDLIEYRARLFDSDSSAFIVQVILV